MMPRAPFSFLRPAVAGALLLASACTDRNPAAVSGRPAPSLPDGPAAALSCTVEVRAGTVACRPAGAATGARAVIVGGQGTNVRVASSGTTYDSVAQVLRAQVTVQNLTAQALAAAGDAAPQEGVRVFFHSGPDVTAGSGAVTVANADGEATFTAAAQKYFQYDGVLVPGATSAPKEWRFSVPPTVITFAFTVYVAAGVRGEAGWVGVAPLAPSLLVGDTQRVTAVVRGVTGRVLPGEPVAWWSSNRAVAAVDSAGVVTAVGIGTAFITATSGRRAGRAAVEVFQNAALRAPTLVSFELDRTVVTASDADSLAIRVATKAGGVGTLRMEVWMKGPGVAGVYVCDAFTLVSGTANDGVRECRLPVGPYYSRRGVWRVENLTLEGPQDNRRFIDTDVLLAGGAPTYLRVENESDVTAPVLKGFTFSPRSLSTGNTEVTVDAVVADSGEVERLTVNFRNAKSTFPLGCTSPRPYSGTATNGTFRCGLAPFDGIPGGDWVVDEVRLIDVVGNVSVWNTADLVAAGYPTVLKLSIPNPDTVPPAITALSFGGGVVGNTRNSLFVTLTGDAGQTGILEMWAVFQKVGGTQTRRCAFDGFTVAATVTARCAFQFDASEAGLWRVTRVYALDYGYGRTFTPAELQASGFPIQFTVITQ